MPVFTQQPKRGAARRRKGAPQQIVERYKQYIEKLEDGYEGFLTFDEKEDMQQGREALKEAGVQLQKYVKVAKVRGTEAMLRFERISRQEYDGAQDRAGAGRRGEKRRKGARKAP